MVPLTGILFFFPQEFTEAEGDAWTSAVSMIPSEKSATVCASIMVTGI